jgi:F0F1-type ATP synthase membrane subunit c/vacuolar-type H+-ATPase subunit K
MHAQKRVDPWWAALTVWGVVNAVNMLQSAGFLSRVYTGNREMNQLFGLVMIALAIPSVVALVALVRARAGWRQWIGPAVYLAFVAFEVVVDYIWPVEFRSPMRYDILVPYLLLFFGAILLMGLPMFRLNRRLWLVTVTTTVLLLGSMGVAMVAGVG